MPALINGQVLRAVREAKGWNQQTLARHAGIDKSVISRLEREMQDDLKVSVLVAVATALEIPANELLSSPPRQTGALRAASLPAWDMREAVSEERGHGRHEQRRVTASTELNDYLDWPGVGQVVMVARRWEERGVSKRAVRYGITSLAPRVADAARLGALIRGHWQIENGLHYVKGVTLGEDRSTIHTGNGPSVMAILRDTVVSVLHRGDGGRSPSGYATTAVTQRKSSPSLASP